MPFQAQVDPNIPLAAFNPEEAQARGFTLGQAMQQNQRETEQYEQGKRQQGMLRDIFQRSDTSTPEGKQDLVRQVSGVNPALGMQLSGQFGQQAKVQADIAKDTAQTESARATAAYHLGQMQKMEKDQRVQAFTRAAIEAESDVKEYDQAVAQGKLPAQVSEKIGRDMQALAPEFESFGVFPKETIDKMRSGQFNIDDARRAAPMLRAQADQSKLIAWQKEQAAEGREQAREAAPLSDIGKLEADVKAGRITRQEADKEIARKTAPTAAMINIGGDPNTQLSKEDREFMAQQYLAGDQSVMQNLGRGVQGSKNIIALRGEIRRQAEAAGLKPEEVAQKVAEFQGVKAGERALGTRTAQLGMAGNAAFNMADMVVDSSLKANRTRFMPINKALLAYEKNTGDPDVVAFGASLTSFINAYGRAINPTGTATVADKEHAREMLSTAQSHEQIVSVINQLKKEIEAEKRAPGQVKQEMRDLATGRPPKQQASSPASASVGNDPLGIR